MFVKKYTGSACFTRREGHKEEATLDNKMSDSTVDRTVRRLASVRDRACRKTILGKINHNDTHYLSLDAKNILLTVVRDTVATGNFI